MPPRNLPLQDPVKLLASVPQFSVIGHPLLVKLGAACAVLAFPAHSPIYAAGDPIHAAHILVTGSAKRCAMLTDEVERVLELVRPGQIFSLSEIFSAKTYNSYASTIEPCTIISLPTDVLLTTAAKHAALSLQLLETLAQQQFAAEFELVSHHALSGAQRVLDYLLRLAGSQRGIAGETTVRLDASKKLIAARLDMTPETFSRILRQMTSDGVIVVNGRSIHIQNATLAIDGFMTSQNAAAQLRYPRVDKKHIDNHPSAAALVNLCGRHRMLSQRLASAWCVAAREFAPETGRITLRKLHDQFARNMDQVSALPLSPVMRGLMETLGEHWLRYCDLLQSKISSVSHAKNIFEESELTLAAADELTAASATEAGTQAAHCVNISGRNRMLTARLTKLFLFYDMGVHAARAKKIMDESRTEFAVNMEKLRTHAADIPEIMAQLTIDSEHWQSFISVIDAAMSAPPNLQLTHKVMAASEKLLRHVDTTVKLYEKLAERDLSNTKHQIHHDRR